MERTGPGRLASSAGMGTLLPCSCSLAGSASAIANDVAISMKARVLVKVFMFARSILHGVGWFVDQPGVHQWACVSVADIK